MKKLSSNSPTWSRAARRSSMLEPETQSTDRSVRRSQPSIRYARVQRLWGRNGETNACKTASGYVGTFRAEG